MHNNHPRIGIIAILAFDGCVTLGANSDPSSTPVAISDYSDSATSVAVGASPAATLGANGDPLPTPVATSDYSDGANSVAVSPAELIRCQAACNSGKEAMFAFCRSVPDPRLKQPCWIAAAGTAIFCANWCYWTYGR